MKQKNYTSTMVGRPGYLGVAIGVAVAAVVSALMSAGLTSLVMRGMIAESTIKPYVFVIRMMAVLFGGLIGSGLSTGKILPVIGVIVGVYIAILLSVGIVVYDGSFCNFGTGMISVVIGGLIACVIKLKPQMKPKRAIRHKR